MPGFLASLLRVDRVGELAFSARLHDYGHGSFGGDALGRAALAGSLTCGRKLLHSLHASFLRPLPAAVPLGILVVPLADGRRFARRRIEIRQEERLLCHVTASFVEPGTAGEAWQEVRPPAVPEPEELLGDEELAQREGWPGWDPEQEEFAWRFVGRPYDPSEPASGDASRWSVWLRPRAPLPDDPRVHAAALAFLSDYSSQWSAARRLGRRLDAGAFVSLDHVVRIHRPPRWDDWWLSHAWSEVAHAGRSLWHRQLFDREGGLIASISQEGLIAPDGPPP
jgi:acyl-CoA thioesterase-2